ncbi:MAG: bifunctional demethylmenaquinone methyltransferase/2-methoxy-6-polyprenyl-1,4-benzoquinol methylase UbiE [Ignavibacteria bacterium]|nr:bifunctional demethylmenaquinone methyltransferase/2-methoxy-6-polyprenyl-1,4-benzoquinol methylase UbiE [Ignavibacteria bacterium]
MNEPNHHPHLQSRSDPKKIQSMFDAIAPTYDLLNHLLSFGFDIRWRKKAVNLLTEKKGGAFLDIAAGSGDISLDLLTLRPQMIVSADFAVKMLNIFQRKISTQPDEQHVSLVSCDALSLPFRDGMFDATIVAFGIRNFADRLVSLKEMLRVLQPDGCSVILELSMPKAPIASQLYRLYSQRALPALGRIISKHNDAYRYLPESIAHFPEQKEFLALMREAGFVEVKAVSLTFGAATIFFGRKNRS